MSVNISLISANTVGLVSANTIILVSANTVCLVSAKTVWCQPTQWAWHQSVHAPRHSQVSPKRPNMMTTTKPKGHNNHHKISPAAAHDVALLLKCDDFIARQADLTTPGDSFSFRDVGRHGSPLSWQQGFAVTAHTHTPRTTDEHPFITTKENIQQL